MKALAMRDMGSTLRDRVTLNVGGIRHESRISTLLKFPGTRLAILAKLREDDESYEAETKEYYFDRHPFAFLQILEYYRTDELHMSEDICGNAMKKELEYWGIYETEIETCCWGNYSKFLEHRETLANLDTTFGVLGNGKVDKKTLSTWKRFQLKIWNNLEYPSTSRGAKVLMIISVFVVMVSIVTFVVESHFWFQVYANDTSMRAPDPEPFYPSANNGLCCSEIQQDLGPPPETEPHIAILYIEGVCLIFFTIEILIRIIFAPSKCDFLKGPLNIVDIICLIPQVISVLLANIPQLAHVDGQASELLSTVTLLRTVRVLRIFKLMKHYSAFKVLAYTIKVSTKELALMIAMLLIGVLICGSAIYYAERDSGNFTSIPMALWWALVTMTTVGYGDRVPKEPAGYVIGCVCVISGVLVIAFTVPIVVNNFSLYYAHAQTRIKLPASSKLRVKKPGNSGARSSMVSVRPAKCNIPEMDRISTLASSRTTSSYTVFGESSETAQLTGKSNRLRIHTISTPENESFHELEARRLVDNMTEQEKIQKSEKRRQYMMAFNRLEKKRKVKA